MSSFLYTICMTVDKLRQEYLKFFKQKGHKIIPSASLVPENDPTSLFISSGMQPIMPYLLGESHPEGKRLANSQKCFRMEDIDEVGDNRHTTFFEMLGNWSLGDYFKAEQIPWVFEFLTKEIGLDPNRLYVTCYEGNDKIGILKDEEAAKLWVEQFEAAGVDASDRVSYYGDDKNWWSRAGAPSEMPEGEPGGPDSEIFWDFDPDAKLGIHKSSVFAKQKCHTNCDCGRYSEIGNSVFMEYVKTKKGFEPLPNKNIDFGGGLERMVAAVNDDPDIFKINVFEQARTKLEEISGLKYDQDEETTKAFRVILDHLRAVMFLIANWLEPSNKDQGYFIRRLIRRAVRYGHQLGIEQNFCEQVAEKYNEPYCGYYKEMNYDITVTNQIHKEEVKFRSTLVQGLKEMKKFGNKMTVTDAFYLYQSFGFPLEMINEELGGDVISEKEFKKEFEKHQKLSRAGAEQKFKGGLADRSEITTKYHTATHLLHQALRQVLGDHVKQRGSNITDKRLRFDFSHSEKMTDEQKQEVERIVNEAIEADLPVSVEEMTVEEAKKAGAIGLFEAKYGDKVKVYSIGDNSKEICGGPHVERTGKLGHFHIKKEQASSAGIRRIKAVLDK